MFRALMISTSAAALLGTGPAAADPVLSLGLTFQFGGDAGVTAGIWSDNEEEEVVGGLTGTYYFRSGQIGAGANVGYVFDGAIGSLGYDFVQQGITLGIHAIDSDDAAAGGGDGSGVSRPPPPPPPPPVPVPPTPIVILDPTGETPDL